MLGSFKALCESFDIGSQMFHDLMHWYGTFYCHPHINALT